VTEKEQASACVCVRVCACMSMRKCVCVCVGEREREECDDVCAQQGRHDFGSNKFSRGTYSLSPPPPLSPTLFLSLSHTRTQDLGNKAFSQGNFDEAIEHFTHALTLGHLVCRGVLRCVAVCVAACCSVLRCVSQSVAVCSKCDEALEHFMRA